MCVCVCSYPIDFCWCFTCCQHITSQQKSTNEKMHLFSCRFSVWHKRSHQALYPEQFPEHYLHKINMIAIKKICICSEHEWVVSVHMSISVALHTWRHMKMKCWRWEKRVLHSDLRRCFSHNARSNFSGRITSILLRINEGAFFKHHLMVCMIYRARDIKILLERTCNRYMYEWQKKKKRNRPLVIT